MIRMFRREEVVANSSALRKQFANNPCSIWHVAEDGRTEYLKANGELVSKIKESTPLTITEATNLFMSDKTASMDNDILIVVEIDATKIDQK